MAKILIGSEYIKTFDSIVEMYKNNCVPTGLIKSIGEDSIITDTHEFVLLRDKSKRQRGINAQMTEQGASWFGNFRGITRKNEIADWLMFVETIKEYFHRNYSLVEYCPREHKLTANQIALQKQLIGDLLAKFYPDYNFEIVKGKEEEGKEDIYGASLRMELTDGTGEAVPVLGKVFFKKTAKGILPYQKDEAEQISGYLSGFDKTQEDFVSKQNSLDLTDRVVEAVDKLASSDIGDASLSDYLVFASDKDSDAVDIMVEKGPNEFVDIVCQNLTIMNISHVEWKTDNYDIKLGGKTVLKAVIGIGGRLSLWCNVCLKKSILIESNKIKYRYDGKRKLLMMDLTRDNFGIPDKILVEIKESGLFSKHINKVVCTENARLAGACVRYVCEDDLAVLEDGIKKCKNCPYPEVVFRCFDGVLRYTKNLAFVRDKMTLVNKDNTITCKCCGRPYYFDSNGDNKKPMDYVCDFCKVAKSGIYILDFEEYRQGNELYRKYARMLPYDMRMKYIGKRKVCKEDEDCILFVMDKDVYMFDKENLEKEGFLLGPKKIQL